MPYNDQKGSSSAEAAVVQVPIICPYCESKTESGVKRSSVQRGKRLITLTCIMWCQDRYHQPAIANLIRKGEEQPASAAGG
jgi:hypothetical protein